MDKKPIISPEEMPGILNEFLSRDEVRSREFWKSFKDRHASRQLPVPSLYDCVEHSVCYDDQQRIDVRLLSTLIIPADVNLFQDVATWVIEDFTNERASDLTLRQFKAQLTRRMEQVGF